MMKLPTILFFGLFLANVNADDLTTTDGKVYKDYKVSKVEPDGLRIIHSAGMGKVKFEVLPTELQEEHGYDPEVAEEFAEESKEAQRKAQDKIEADKRAYAEHQKAEARESNAILDAEKKAKAEVAAINASAPKAASFPAPTTGKSYNVSDLKMEKASLVGKVVRAKLSVYTYITPTGIEGGWKVPVWSKIEDGVLEGSSKDIIHVTWPESGKKYLDSLYKKKTNEGSYYVQTMPGGAFHVIGRTMKKDTSGRGSYSW